MVAIKQQDTQEMSVMEQLLQSSIVKPLPKVGDMIEGAVISVSKKEVLIDFPGLTTGVVRGPELVDESGEYDEIKLGDIVSATVLMLENERGEIECSFRSAGHKRAWESAAKLMASGTLLKAKVLSANKGGLMTSVNRLQGFLPVSQLTPEHYPRVVGGDKQKILEKLQSLVGTEMEVKVLDVNDQEGKLIVSEKKAFEEKQRKTMLTYTVGSVVEGVVSGITSFGAFLRFDQNLEGLIHISELSWQRVDEPSSIVKVGETLKVKIIGIDGSKISLSLKQLTEDPWKKAVEVYHVGQRVRGVVKRINPYGLLVELNPTIQGLAHISQLGVARSSDLPTVAKIGQEMDFIIVTIDPGQHRLGLSRKLLDEGLNGTTTEPTPTSDLAEASPSPQSDEAPSDATSDAAPIEEETLQPSTAPSEANTA